MIYNFLTDTGLSFAEAEALKAKALAFMKNNLDKLANLGFVDSFIERNGGENKVQSRCGASTTELGGIAQLLTDIAEADALAQWLSAALKEKADTERFIRNLSSSNDDYCALSGDVFPEYNAPDEAASKSAILTKFDVKERCRYYAAQTRSSVYGKFIHPNGSFSQARNRFYQKKEQPITIAGEGQNALIYTYTTTVDNEQIDAAFFALQNGHREAQALFNSLLEKVNDGVHKDEVRYVQEEAERTSAYNQAVADFNSRKTAFQAELSNELNGKRVLVPAPFNRIVALLR